MELPVHKAPSAQDYADIQHAIACYVWALDMGDFKALEALFTEDALFEDTSGNEYPSREAFLDYARQLTARPEFRGRQHHIDNLLIEPTEDGFSVHAYWTVTKWFSAENRKIVEVTGWSFDRFRRTPEGLKFCERRVHYWRDVDCPWARTDV
jgi:hypothetical protein